jgi:uncharacterized membrane protein
MKRLFFSVLVSLGFVAAAASGAEPDRSVEPAVEVPGHGKRLAQWLEQKGLPREWVVVTVAAMPVLELRGAIPLGFFFKMHPALTYSLAVTGNLLPVPLIVLLLRPVSRWMTRFRWGKRFFDWLFARAHSKRAEIERYEMLGLAIFVAIPLPATGAWTGAMAAFVMGLSFTHTMVSILLGVLVAGLIMTLLCLIGWWGAIVATVVLVATGGAAFLPWLRGNKRQPTQP